MVPMVGVMLIPTFISKLLFFKLFKLKNIGYAYIRVENKTSEKRRFPILWSF